MDKSLEDFYDINTPCTIKYYLYIKKRLKQEIPHYKDIKVFEKELATYPMNFNIKLNNMNSESKVTFYVSIGVSKDNKIGNIQGSVNLLDANKGVHINLVTKAFNSAFCDIFGYCNGYESTFLNFLIIALIDNPSFDPLDTNRLLGIHGFNIENTLQLEGCFKDLINKYYIDFEDYYYRILDYISIMNTDTENHQLNNKLILSSEHHISELSTPVNLRECYTSDRSNAWLYIVNSDNIKDFLLSNLDEEFSAILTLSTRFKKIYDTKVVDAL